MCEPNGASSASAIADAGFKLKDVVGGSPRSSMRGDLSHSGSIHGFTSGWFSERTSAKRSAQQSCGQDIRVKAREPVPVMKA